MGKRQEAPWESTEKRHKLDSTGLHILSSPHTSLNPPVHLQAENGGACMKKLFSLKGDVVPHNQWNFSELESQAILNSTKESSNRVGAATSPSTSTSHKQHCMVQKVVCDMEDQDRLPQHRKAAEVTNCSVTIAPP
ncbi:hypothetical protein TURU_015525 [Turdus rufiventris]|nr:hypothetical protein TURU_015525 [Turdus rufiventris]